LDEGVTPTWYADLDADGFGDATTAVMQCLNPGGYILDGTDCDDLHWMYVDADGDGYGLQLSSPVACGVLVATDCNDSQINVNPSVVESCNAIDDNCNGVLDEGLLSTFYADGDQDSFGDLNDPLQACTLPAGYVLNFLDCVPTALTYADNDGDGEGAGAAIPCGVLSNTDCNDNNSSVFSAQTEVCNLQDDNCNFEIDEFVQEVFYADLDLDGFGDINNITIGCSPAPGYTADGQDCNDNLITYEDLDGDTYGSTVWAPCGVTNTLDCDDNDATYSPSFIEWCDGNDNNCNGLIDEGVSQVYYLDLDGDGYGNLATALQACSQPFGYVSDFTDCNDLNAGVNSSAIEVCNGQDDDCDGNADNGVLNTYYLDMDGDGFGDPNQAIQQCFLPLGAVSNALDCDDSSILYEDFDGDGFGSLNWVACNGVYDSSDCHDTLANVYPAQVEVCNGIDDNCNILIDEGVTTMFFADSDGDGFGDGNVVTSSCSVPSGYSNNTLDCDDTQITYLDADLDGYGSNTIVPCGILDNTDCNDADATLSPSAQEICNSIDDNCNFEIDEGLSITYYADVDGDGFGDGNNFILACSLPVNYVLDTQDCDDNNSNVSPVGTEVCNGIDDNCTGQIDEGVTHWYYADLDNDGYGGNDSIQACTLPDGYVTDTLDCNDNEPLMYPGGIEGLNGVDDNCDGLIDEGFEFVPDAFSPNGDGQFDQFFIARIHPDEQVKLEIYNRWGIVVYESSDYQNDWDGKGNAGETDGNELSAGTYFYVASFSHDNTVKRGYITLWR
jgi:gliding motility-associated-like protein